MTFAAVTDLALQLHPCVEDLQRLFSLWDDEEVSHGTFTLTDLRKALPVVGVSAHPVDVQLLFDAWLASTWEPLPETTKLLPK